MYITGFKTALDFTKSLTQNLLLINSLCSLMHDTTAQVPYSYYIIVNIKFNFDPVAPRLLHPVIRLKNEFVHWSKSKKYLDLVKYGSVSMLSWSSAWTSGSSNTILPDPINGCSNLITGTLSQSGIVVISHARLL